VLPFGALHPEEPWPRRWVHRRWLFAGLALLLALAAGGIAAAVLLAAGGDETAQPVQATPSVLPPQSFEAEPGELAVTLDWSAPKGGVEIDHYDIYRNGSPLVTLSDVGSTYVDDEVRPGKEYTYEIEARGVVDGKEMTSERLSATVTAPVPPLKRARVEGDFAVTVKTLSQSGYNRYENPTYGWHMRAKCRTGPCEVVWGDLHEKGIHTVLKQNGARYSGSYSGFFFDFCGNARGTSSVKIELKVAKAKAIEGEWLATKLVGTVNKSSGAQLGCVSSRASQAVTAKLVG
jgi:hypothetical protein